MYVCATADGQRSGPVAGWSEDVVGTAGTLRADDAAPERAKPAVFLGTTVAGAVRIMRFPAGPACATVAEPIKSASATNERVRRVEIMRHRVDGNGCREKLIAIGLRITCLYTPLPMTQRFLRFRIGFAIASFLLLAPAFAAAKPITAPVAITHDGMTAGNVAMVLRKNGDLVVIFNSGAEPNGTFASISKDKGKTWSAQTYINSGWDRAALLENHDTQLVLVSNEGSGYSVSISDDGTTWRSIGMISILQPNYIIGDLMQAKDGSYYFTYSSYEEPQPIHMYVYVSRSHDLKGWSKPVQISKNGYSEFSSSMVQNKNGSFALAYHSSPEKGMMLSTSKNGQTWTTPKRMTHTGMEAPIRLRLTTLSSKPALVYGNDKTANLILPRGSRWSRSTIIYSPSYFESAVVDMGSGTLGIAFFPAAEGPRNIFFNTIQTR
ncbi:MAG: hypothetical protein Greene041619_1197 [Candidatus Peregrinibacteria bacterium Greene0416_19]|nr:MAG: hypothetical protein Greene041619_1197 [Candidatus Peregrinibacteria bacterium Greene0416_19]